MTHTRKKSLEELLGQAREVHARAEPGTPMKRLLYEAVKDLEAMVAKNRTRTVAKISPPMSREEALELTKGVLKNIMEKK